MYPNLNGSHHQQRQNIGFELPSPNPPHPQKGQAPGYPSLYPQCQGSLSYPRSPGFSVPPVVPGYPSPQYPTEQKFPSTHPSGPSPQISPLQKYSSHPYPPEQNYPSAQFQPGPNDPSPSPQFSSGQNYQSPQFPSGQNYQSLQFPSGQNYQSPQFPSGQNYPSPQFPSGQNYPSQQFPPRQNYQSPQFPSGQNYQSPQFLSGQNYQSPQFPSGQNYPSPQFPSGQNYPSQQFPSGQNYPSQQFPPGQNYSSPQFPTTPQYPQQQLVNPTQSLYTRPQGAHQGYPVLEQPVYDQSPIQKVQASNINLQFFRAPNSLDAGAQTPAMKLYKKNPTIREEPFDPTEDAIVLRKAMKGLGTDEKSIINVLAKRTENQRQEIVQSFKKTHGRDLIKDLKSELSGRFEQVIISLMTPRYVFLAQILHKAMSGFGTKEIALVDILCTSTNSDIRSINAYYHQLYGRPLEKDLYGDTSGHFRSLLVSLTSAERSEDTVVNLPTAITDAKKLCQAAEKKGINDESMFNMILSSRSYGQLCLMFQEYERLSGHPFEHAIKKRFSGDVRTGMLAVVKSAKNLPAYFAERLHESIAGLGTNSDDLIFIIVTRAEIDLENIKVEYRKLYNETLTDAVKGDTKGDYCKILLALLGI